MARPQPRTSRAETRSAKVPARRSRVRRTGLRRQLRMTPKRKPVAYGDLRGWLKALEAAGELREINGEVDWNIELGTIARLAQGAGTGPALLFNNIKGYNTPSSRCRRVFTGGLSSYRRMAMLLGLGPDAHPRELVRVGRNIMSGSIPP